MFDETKHYLGPLCKRGHSWQDTHQSLRYLSCRICVECSAEKAKTYRTTPTGKAALKAAYIKWRSTEQGKAFTAEYGKKPDRADARSASQLRYRRTTNGQATRKRAETRYAQTEGRRISWRRKDIKRKKLKSGNREYYGVVEIQERWTLFDNACAYCGSTDRLTKDHFVSLNCGGADAIWNIVPACFSCNASKQDDDAEQWYRKSRLYSEHRWQRIVEAMRREGWREG